MTNSVAPLVVLCKDKWENSTIRPRIKTKKTDPIRPQSGPLDQEIDGGDEAT